MDFENQIESNKGAVELVVSLAGEVNALDSAITQAENALKSLKQRKNAILQTQIPETMVEAGIGNVMETASGLRITVGMYVSGTLPKTELEHAEALKYIAQRGGAPLIKDTFTIELGRGDHEVASDLAANLDGLGVGYKRKLDVNAMTLKKFVRENIESGSNFDPEEIGLHVGQIAKVSVK